MKEYTISRSEKDGDIAFYPDRKKIWDFLIQHNCFDDIIVNNPLQNTVTHLKGFAHGKMIANGNSHVHMIIRTIAKYIVYGIKSDIEENDPKNSNK